MFDALFQRLGFTEKEAKIFLLIIQYGSSAASTLARLSGIKRTTVYNILNSLVAKGVVSYFRQGAYTYFQIDDLNKLVLYEKERVNTAKILIDNLKIYTGAQQNIQVNYYRGLEGYLNVYTEMLEVKPKEILCWTDNSFEKHFTQQQDLINLKDRVKKNIYIRILMKENQRARDFKKEDKGCLRETRIIPADRYSFDSTVFVYQDYVAFFDFHEPITAIRINHPGIYVMMKEIFETCWPLY